MIVKSRCQKTRFEVIKHDFRPQIKCFQCICIQWHCIAHVINMQTAGRGGFAGRGGKYCFRWKKIGSEWETTAFSKKKGKKYFTINTDFFFFLVWLMNISSIFPSSVVLHRRSSPKCIVSPGCLHINRPSAATARWSQSQRGLFKVTPPT